MRLTQQLPLPAVSPGDRSSVEWEGPFVHGDLDSAPLDVCSQYNNPVRGSINATLSPKQCFLKRHDVK